MSRILIVDDMPSFASFIVYVLADSGYMDCVVKHDPLLAIEYIKEHNNIQLIVTDFYMPEMNGIEFLNAVNKINSKIKGIIVTTEAETVMKIKNGYKVIEKWEVFDSKFIDIIKNEI